MKKLYLTAFLNILGHVLFAQGIYIKGGHLSLLGLFDLQVKGNFILDGGSFHNGGQLDLSGNLVNNSTTGIANIGKIRFVGNTPQSISGTAPFLAQYAVIDNTAGITLNTEFRVEDYIIFGEGLIHAQSAFSPLVFSENALSYNAKPESYVNGFVMKEGIGPFRFPVGSSTAFQPIKVDITENSNGLLTKYYEGDAGAATFGTTGTSPIALEAYNNQEYWDINPVGTAKGKITLTWDQHNNPSITPSIYFTVLSIAHKTSEGWLNEGSAKRIFGDPDFDNSLSYGNVEGGSLSNWGIFTLGSIPEAALPVTLVAFSGRKQETSSLLEWSTAEEEKSSHFQVERSIDTKNFEKIGKVDATGGSIVATKYSFIDDTFSQQPGVVYYRLKTVDVDGSFAFSKVISLRNTSSYIDRSIYPNPANRRNGVVVRNTGKSGQISVVDMLGRTIITPVEHLSDGNTKLDLSDFTSGMYLIKINADSRVNVQTLLVE
ncbi:T9SS type A sorting domain-containing protein [Dyadobacter fanqingshengii]|uniref:T9SS type A sorting domain-containing protein n=1 Tax=Dyadobacter fanqingshengii TaxID=2906443 RepID=A0A9X1PBG6_9BACT|nr:T9SS type A sorting domain-containing protein [Dyadobacter fanqingshengii]MCF0040843.1 T9SS type A sorting domain-containing protein [Dyadobacter fanqingshengii]USJ37424.1 T9SS type A sorting domain-containing protein [Dyadobacter fanqingshengii]